MTRSPLPVLATLAAAFATALGPTATPAAANARLDGLERAVIRHVNAFRARNGLGIVRHSHPLSRSADRHSRDMVRRDFLTHFSSDGTPFDARIRRYAGAKLVGETLAALPRGGGGAAAVVRIWRHSPPHRAILLARQFQRIGVARRWGSVLGGPSAVFTADFASAH